MITVKFNRSGWNRAIDDMGRKAPIAISRALNRTTSNVNTAMVRTIAADLGVKQADVRDYVLTSSASPNRLVSTIAASAKRLPLVDFKARQTRAGVSYRLPGSPGKIPSAFIVTLKSGHRGVFQRLTKAHLPIQELFGPSVWKSFHKNESVAQTRANEMLEKNLRHEFRFVLDLS